MELMGKVVQAPRPGSSNQEQGLEIETRLKTNTARLTARSC